MLLEEERHRSTEEVRAETAGLSLQAKVSRQPLGGGQGTVSPEVSRTLRMNFCLSHPVCAGLLQKPQDMKTRGSWNSEGARSEEGIWFSAGQSSSPALSPGPERWGDLSRVTQHAWQTPAPGPWQSSSYLLPAWMWGTGMEAWLRQLMAVGPGQDT